MLIRITDQAGIQIISGWRRGDKLARWMDRYCVALRERGAPAVTFPRLAEVTTDSGRVREVWAPPTPATPRRDTVGLEEK